MINQEIRMFPELFGLKFC